METVFHVREFIYNYGKPTRVISDRGTAFTAATFEQFCREHNIIHAKVAIKSSRSNGQVEIINGIEIKCLAMTNDKKDDTDWDFK